MRNIVPEIAILNDFHKWRKTHVPDIYMLYIISFIIGIFTALAAIVLKNLVHYVNQIVVDHIYSSQYGFLLLFMPTVGILLTVLFVRYIVKDDLSHGVTKILYSISKQKGDIKFHNSYTSMIASSITVGFGGSVGLEAPITYTGAAIGSNIGKWFGLTSKQLMLMVGCGAAGAVAGIFKAPLAGVVFALEIIMIDLTIVSIVPLLITSITSATLSYFLLGKGVMFTYTPEHEFILSNLPYYIILGVVCGFVSLYFTRMLFFIEKKFKKVTNFWIKIPIGGLSLALMIYFMPSLFGEGYIAIDNVLNGKGWMNANDSLLSGFMNTEWFLVAICLLIIFLKPIASACTTGAGGIGGTFAPALFMGAITGFFTAAFLNLVFSALDLPAVNFGLVGMAAVMAGFMQAPLTGIFLIAEITGGFGLLTPLLVASTISFITMRMFEKHSIYTKHLAESKELVTHDTDQTALIQMNIASLIERDFIILNVKDKLGDLVRAVEYSHRNMFPVIDNDGYFIGMINQNNVKHLLFKNELYDSISVKSLMHWPSDIISVDDNMHDVAKIFSNSKNYNIPVLDNGKYVGYASRANVFSTYRKIVKDFSEEDM